jgi:hypothetical protein
VGPDCHRDGKKFGVVPNILQNLSSTVEPLHGEISWICSSGAIFAELELSQTRPKAMTQLEKGHMMNIRTHLSQARLRSKRICTS